MFQHLLGGTDRVSKVHFIELLEVLLVEAGDNLLHEDIGDRLLYLLRLLERFLLLLKGHDIE